MFKWLTRPDYNTLIGPGHTPGPMVSARRLKRNVKRLLIPLETALLWIAGPFALAFYWLWHGVIHGARLVGGLLTIWR